MPALEALLSLFLALANETLTATIVIIAASLLLYNLSRNLADRVTRSSSVVLACVTLAYIADVFVSLQPDTLVLGLALRLQWTGIALVPAALFHLSDALLTTTGLPSRGRRRRMIRVLYASGLLFLLLALFDISLVQPTAGSGLQMRAGPLFPLYALFFIGASLAALRNVQRARQRCLTQATSRRMGYLQLAILTPALGLFPWSVLVWPGPEQELAALTLVNLSNVVIVLMLLFLAWPLSFFGSRTPVRVIKLQLLRFLLRGPATATIALVVILYTVPTTSVLGLPGQQFMPFAVVAAILLWQWLIALALPLIERRLVYSGEDESQLEKLQELGEQLLTRSDLLMLLEATLSATCDYLQVNSAFVFSLREDCPRMVASIGENLPEARQLAQSVPGLRTLADDMRRDEPLLQCRDSFWLAPLFSARSNTQPTLIGCLGVQADAEDVALDQDERRVFAALLRRSEQALDDLALQGELYAALEGLLPQMNLSREGAPEVEYRIAAPPAASHDSTAKRRQLIEQVRAALRHYWGGPGLTRSNLLELELVRTALQSDANPPGALRAVLVEAIEMLRPPGERSLTSPEWTLYNILKLRFIERRRVRDVAARLAISEADLYRKQRVAIESVADSLLQMEAARRRN